MCCAAVIDQNSNGISKFLNAAMGIDTWQNALNQFADYTRASRAQLVGIDKTKKLVFHSVTELPMKARVNFTEIDGNNPKINTRLMASNKYAPMTIVGDKQYQEMRPYLINQDYIEYCEKWEMPFGCQSTLIKDSELTVLLMSLRNQKDGVTTPDDYKRFQDMAMEVKNAVHIARCLENQGEMLLSNSLDNMSINAFICDSKGLVCAKTNGACDALIDNDLLDMKYGRLVAKTKPDQFNLDNAIIKAVEYGQDSSICLKGDGLGDILLLDVARLPNIGWNFNFLPKAIIKIRNQNEKYEIDLIKSAHNLTSSEAQIAIMLVKGFTREEIAKMRHSSIQTVRTQLKRIFDKLEISREIELAAKLALFA